MIAKQSSFLKATAIAAATAWARLTGKFPRRGGIQFLPAELPCKRSRRVQAQASFNARTAYLDPESAHRPLF
jgi:hypothetical protein